MQHAMQCFARLVRVLLGSGAVAAGKLACGSVLVVLGVVVTPAVRGFLLKPSPDKVLVRLCIVRAPVSCMCCVAGVQVEEMSPEGVE